MESVDPFRTEFDFRAERLRRALHGLAAELVEERRKVAQLRREVAALRARLASVEPGTTEQDVVDASRGPASD